MARVEVLDEQEATAGWVFRVRISHDGGEPTEHSVALSWVDHDYWSGGASPPASVVQRVMEYLVEQESRGTIPERMDAASVRRRYPEIDQLLFGRL